MSEFQVFLQIGIQHIINLEGLDHILFIVVLCAAYSPQDWKKILLLVTAFTIGHTLSLILATLDLIPIDKNLIETLIPITIIITALNNLLQYNKQKIPYFMAVFFGIIHGLAFAKDLKSLLMFSKENFIIKLLAFNIGIEIGQLAIVVLLLIIFIIFAKLFQHHQKILKQTISLTATLVALYIIIERTNLLS
ncbi:MAG: HupE/UreJ family protein [Cytophagales bacterium]|nr:MAG: HupE/UreJ family protein [Cytophagales bacterium]